MKVILAGAYGMLGREVLAALVDAGHEVIAADMVDSPPEGLATDPASYIYAKIDVTNPKTLIGLCEGADAVITTVGLTKTSATTTNYEIDYQGNLNLLHEAQRAGVPRFIYISVIKADQAPDVPMLDAKHLMEEELKKSGIQYVIHRPTGYFYDIIKVFRPMIEEGKVTLLGKDPVRCNVVDTPDFARFIVEHIDDKNVTYNVGGKETWSYEQIARMCFDAAGKPAVIKTAPPWLFDVLGNLPANRKNGKKAILKFSKWTLTEEMVGDTIVGDASFKQCIYDSFTPEAEAEE